MRRRSLRSDDGDRSDGDDEEERHTSSLTKLSSTT